MGFVVWIPQKGHARNTWNKLLQELYPLGAHFRAKDGIAGDISVRPTQTRHEARPHGIADSDHNDGYGRRRLLGGSSRGRPASNYYVHRQADEIPCGGGEPVWLPFSRSILQSNIASLHVTEFA